MATSFTLDLMCNMAKRDYLIGSSQDLHVLVRGRPLILGGVNIPYELGLLGHSDADVIYHVVSESILGALALGDLGMHFSDRDPKNKDLDSATIVSYAVRLMKTAGYEVNNIDISVSVEEPKLAKYILEMRTNIANLLEINVQYVSVKATTNEKQDSVGRGESIEARATVLLRSKE